MFWCDYDVVEVEDNVDDDDNDDSDTVLMLSWVECESISKFFLSGFVLH